VVAFWQRRGEEQLRRLAEERAEKERLRREARENDAKNRRLQYTIALLGFAATLGAAAIGYLGGTNKDPTPPPLQPAISCAAEKSEWDSRIPTHPDDRLKPDDPVERACAINEYITKEVERINQRQQQPALPPPQTQAQLPPYGG
jgi:hypothetical protein